MNEGLRGEYEIWLSDKAGNRLAVLDQVVAFEYTKVANDIGSFFVTLPHTFDETLIDKDRIVSFWRKPIGGAQALDFRGVVLNIFEREEVGGDYSMTLYGASQNHYLQRRILAYAAQTSYTDKTDQVDDMMKAIVRENLGSLVTDAERNMTADGLSVQSDVGLGPSETRSFSYKNVLTTLRDLSEISRTDGTEVFFSIEPTGAASFEFRTQIQQPGYDRRGKMIFSRDFGNLGWAQYQRDWSDFGNLVYAAGQGDGLSREIVTAYLDPTEPSGLYRTEVFKDARNDGFTAMLTAAAAAAVQEARVVQHFSGEALNAPRSMYGLDWGFGDYVSVSFRGRQFDAIIRATTVSMRNQQESISAMLEAYL